MLCWPPGFFIEKYFWHLKDVESKKVCLTPYWPTPTVTYSNHCEHIITFLYGYECMLLFCAGCHLQFRKILMFRYWSNVVNVCSACDILLKGFVHVTYVLMYVPYMYSCWQLIRNVLLRVLHCLRYSIYY